MNAGKYGPLLSSIRQMLESHAEVILKKKIDANVVYKSIRPLDVYKNYVMESYIAMVTL
jgi:hypothetical protein